MVVQCCVCKRIRENNSWAKPTLPLTNEKAMSHGYCPNCADEAFREVREYHRHNLHGLGTAKVVNS